MQEEHSFISNVNATNEAATLITPARRRAYDEVPKTGESEM